MDTAPDPIAADADTGEAGDLELFALTTPRDRGVTDLEREVRSSLAALRAAGRLEPADAGVSQLAIELSRAIAAGARSGRASAVALASAQLLACFDRLNPPDEGGDGDDFDRWRAYLDGAATAHGSGA